MKTHADKTQENKNQSVAKEVPKQTDREFTVEFEDNRPEAIAQRKFQEMVDNSPQAKQLRASQEMIDNSPRMERQRQQIERMFGSPVQKKEALPEEELQMKAGAAPIQREGPEEEELLQGKFETVQKQGPEEEELLQGKFEPVQKQGPEEDEILQGKFETVQKQSPEEEELLQGKFEPIQKKGTEEEELLQGKFDPVQKKGLEEEPLQGKFDVSIQKKGSEEEELQMKEAPVQKKENKTGLPDNLKTGIENLSGLSMDDVKVHRNSDKPAQLNAHAYTQGTDIHVGSGQEKHLPHEAWHVVQQKQGRVKSTMQMHGKVNVNDDAGLEKEADVMGVKALQMKRTELKQPLLSSLETKIVQAKFLLDLETVASVGDKLRETFGEGSAKKFSKFIWQEEVVGNPPKTLKGFWEDLRYATVSDAEEKQVEILINKQAESVETLTESLPVIGLAKAEQVWSVIADSLEKAHISTILRNKIKGSKQVPYPIDSNPATILDKVDWVNKRGSYNGIKSQIPKCQQHYDVDVKKGKGRGAKRIYVKTVKLKDGNGCLIWYSPTHGDTKAKGNDVRLLKGTDREIDGMTHVSPWDIRVDKTKGEPI